MKSQSHQNKCSCYCPAWNNMYNLHNNVMPFIFPVLIGIFLFFSSTTCPSGGSPVIRTSWLFITRWTWSICSTVSSSTHDFYSARTDNRTLTHLPWEKKPTTCLNPKTSALGWAVDWRIANFLRRCSCGVTVNWLGFVLKKPSECFPDFFSRKKKKTLWGFTPVRKLQWATGVPFGS